MIKRIISTCVMLLAVSSLLGNPAVSSDLSSELINGAGATFPYPLYSKWFYNYQSVDPTLKINYMSIGSGGGIRQFIAQVVHFGATDKPMSDVQLSKAGRPILHLPMAMGAIVLCYQLPTEAQGTTTLRLSPEVLSELYLGKIAFWDDPKILELNGDLRTPHTPVVIVRRSDGSGTTAVFTDYLSKVSPSWKKAVGAGMAVRWPAGVGGKGNEGVAGLIKQTPGSMGYIELVFAEKNHLPYAALRNQTGAFVLPSVDTVSAAAAGALAGMPEDFRTSLTDAPGANSYPIASFTYLLIDQIMPKDPGEKIVKFLHWAISDAQQFSKPMFYAPIPPELATKVAKKLEGIQLK